MRSAEWPERSAKIKQSLGTRWFFLKYSLARPDARRAFKEAISNQSLSRDELEELNWKRTCHLLNYAYEHVPYYHDKFSDLGLHPADITKPEHFAQVPVLTREDLQGNLERLISREARCADLKASTTGGSTGQPVKVYHQKQVIRSAMLWRVLDWWGLPPDVNVASIYRDTASRWTTKLLHSLFWWPTKRVLLDASAMDEQNIGRFLRELMRIRPELIHAYVGALDHVAEYILEKNIQVPPPKAIWATCSPLTVVQEKRIEKAFGAPVFDHYGCCEVYWLSAQCPAKKGLHRFHDVVRIEFLDEKGCSVPVGESGRIAITDLQNRFFPLIRYLNGDTGRELAGQCPCGLTLPLMDKVKGRISDSIRLPDGTIIAGEYLTTLFDEYPEVVRRFQVIQRRDYSIDILVVPNVDYGNHQQILETVRAKLAARARHMVPVRLTAVDSLCVQGGKLRFVRSELGG